MRNIILIFVVTLALGSCSVYRKFETPPIVNDSIVGAGVELQDTLVDVASWRQMFSDPYLQQLIQKGVTANSDLQIARHAIEQAEAMLRSSKLAYLPSFMLTPEGNIGSYDNSKASYGYNLPLTMQWELDIFGKIKNSKEQAKAAALQSREYAMMVQTQLVASIANSYYTLVMLDEQLRIIRECVINQKGNLDVIIALKEAGMQTEAAVNQASANYYAVQVSQIEAEKQISLLENSISLLINETPQQIVRNSFNANSRFGVDLQKGISLQALSARPDVKSAEYALRQSFYSVNVARAAFYPSITLGGSAGWTNSLGGAIMNPGSLMLSALGSLTQPLFNKGLNRANLKIAQSQYEQSLITFNKQLLTAGVEVNDAITVCQNSAQKRELRKMQISSSQKAYENSFELMRNSSSTYLEVLIAQNSLLQSQLLQVSDWLEGVQGEINLYKALGGGVN